MLPPDSSSTNEPAAPKRAIPTDPITRIHQAVRVVTAVLDDPSTSFAAARTEPVRVGDALDEPALRYRDDVLPVLRAALGIEHRGERAEVNGAIAVGIELAARLLATQRRDESVGLLHALDDALPPTDELVPVRADLREAEADPVRWLALHEGIELLRRGAFRDADRILARARRGCREPRLRAALDRALSGSRPVDAAPMMATLNGVGARLYGARDARPDGSYVATYCFCFVFIPIWPIAAYRVSEAGFNRYSFHSREPLSRFARIYRWIAGTALAVGLAAWAVTSAYDSWARSPTRLAAEAFEATEARVASMPAEGAAGAWEELVRAHGAALDPAARERAFDALVTDAAASVPSPLTLDRVDAARAVLQRVASLAPELRAQATAAELRHRVVAWADALGHADVDHARAGLDLLDELHGLDLHPIEGDDVETSRRALHASLGDMLADAWPLEAARHWLDAADTAADARALAALAALADEPSLLLDAAPDVTRALARPGGDPAQHDTLARAMDAARALAADSARQAALDASDVTTLEAHLAAHPGDQAVRAELAQLAIARGELPAARALLDVVREEGRASLDLLRARAALAETEGDLAGAAALLTRVVEPRLPLLVAAQRAYEQVAAETEAALDRRLDDSPPADLQQEFERAPNEDAARAVVDAWFRREFASDPDVQRADAEVARLAPVAVATFALASLETRLGRSRPEPEARGHFERAERLFLAVRGPAGSSPDYHLGLGTVYHRLGRTAEGDAEFRALVEQHDATLTMAVAHAYRDLGAKPRARALLEPLVDGDDPAVAHLAASTLASLATTIDDERRWLERADPSAPHTRTALLENDARRLARDGNFAAADQRLQEVVDRYLEGGTAIDQNNAAIALTERFELTGDRRHVVRARALLEDASRRDPDSPISARNLAYIATYEAMVAALDTVLDVDAVRPGPSDAEFLVGILSGGDHGEAVSATVRAHPSLRVALDALHRAQALAPRDAALYSAELDLVRTGDLAALRELAERVAHAPDLDLTEQQAARARWVAGELDAEARHVLDTQLTTLDQRLAGTHGATHAALLALRAATLEQRWAITIGGTAGGATEGTADLELAWNAARDAAADAPGLGFEASATRTALALATARLAATNPPTGAELRETRTWLPALLSALDHDELRAALRADPAVEEALALPDSTSRSGLLIAAIEPSRTVDPERRAFFRAYTELETLVAPSDYDVRYLALLDAAPQPAVAEP